MNHLVYLHSIGIDQKKLSKIFEKDNNYKEIFEKINYNFLKIFYKREEKIKKILEEKNKLNTKFLDIKLQKLNIKIITIHDENYPKLLKEIASPPYFLYVRGALNGDDKFLSIVGSRRISPYSKKAANNIIPDLTKYFTIVSGGAGGCDTIAHKITVENKAKTVVVFGTGIDVTYPTSNKDLFEKVIENGGALVSIFPIGTRGTAFTFPMRNEIVAGMSKGVLALEAGISSGTLITTRLALEYSRDVFAIPGDIFSSHFEGTNELIKNSNAKLVTKSEDILEEYNYKTIPKKEEELTFENEVEGKIYNLLKYNLSLSIDEIIEKLGLDYGEVSLNLSMMELSGVIKKDMLGKYEI